MHHIPRISVSIPAVKGLSAAQSNKEPTEEDNLFSCLINIIILNQ